MYALNLHQCEITDAEVSITSVRLICLLIKVLIIIIYWVIWELFIHLKILYYNAHIKSNLHT